jgi:hypothetical protein
MFGGGGYDVGKLKEKWIVERYSGVGKHCWVLMLDHLTPPTIPPVVHAGAECHDSLHCEPSNPHWNSWL